MFEAQVGLAGHATTAALNKDNQRKSTPDGMPPAVHGISVKSRNLKTPSRHTEINDDDYVSFCHTGYLLPAKSIFALSSTV